MPQKKFLTSARRNWLARLFQNATLVLLAGAVGGEVFLKIPLVWRSVLVAGLVVFACLGLYFATEKTGESED